MDSAAAYGMMVPDDGGPRWAGFPFVARCVVSHEDGRTRFSVYSVSGSGSVVFDFGDGQSRVVELSETGSTAAGTVVDDRRTPLFVHEYELDGEYLVTVTGDLTGIALSGLTRPSGSAAYETWNTVVDGLSAIHDILRMTTVPPRFETIGWWGVDTVVLDSGSIEWQLPLFEEGDDGELAIYPNGPRKLVARGLSVNPLPSLPYFGFPVLGIIGLEELYAPNLKDFRYGNGFHAYSHSPLGACKRLRVAYLPNITKLDHRSYVSPYARGVRLYVGRLTEIGANAFGGAGSSINFVWTDDGCDVELFCQNTRQEILNFPGYPFGAEYLKCHCTDVTFDNEGGFWRNSDGRRVDEFGRLVDDDGRFIDEGGHRVEQDADGVWRWVDAYGRWVDRLDRPIDLETGFLVDSDGHVCDEHGRKCDVLGNLLSYDRYWNGEWMASMAEQVVVDRTMTLSGSARVGTYDVPETDPRYGLYSDEGSDGYARDYFDNRGYLRVREDPDGALYTVVYYRDGSWSVILSQSGGGS